MLIKNGTRESVIFTKEGQGGCATFQNQRRNSAHPLLFITFLEKIWMTTVISSEGEIIIKMNGNKGLKKIRDNKGNQNHGQKNGH